MCGSALEGIWGSFPRKTLVVNYIFLIRVGDSQIGSCRRAITDRWPPAHTENQEYLVVLEHTMQMGLWLKVSLNKPEQAGISETAQGDLCFTKSLVYSHALNHAPRELLKGLIYEKEGEERCHPHIMLRREWSGGEEIGSP